MQDEDLPYVISPLSTQGLIPWLKRKPTSCAIKEIITPDRVRPLNIQRQSEKKAILPKPVQKVDDILPKY